MGVTAYDWVWITLNKIQIRFCLDIAMQRYDNAIKEGRKPANNAPTDPATALKLGELGLMGEGASVVYIKREYGPVKWNYFKTGSLADVADIEDWIDAKATRYTRHSLMLQRNDPPQWAYILACCEQFPRIALMGWCWGHEARSFPISDPVGGRPAHFVPPRAPCLKPMKLLIAELQRR